MASFDRNSNFNAEANFTGVKFGEAKPVLETELNELQEIQNEARAEIIRDTIPSGFVQLGDLDYDYMLNNENCVKLKSDSVAYVNGYKIKIPKDTIINIGKAPEKDAREDLVFLEVWKEEVNKDTILTKNGGEGQAQITNAIKDDRYPVETSRRYAIKWRLRHVPNIDFNANGFIDGFPVVTTYSNNVRPQGGNTSPLIEDTYDTRFINFSVNPEAMKTTSRGLKVPHSNIFYEPGLALSGTGDTNSKNTLKTLDGYVYAVPMFRLYRKPSCGKAIPFEYRKIHPKVDYTKFTNLMKEEKVERVVSENIKGRSLVNLVLPTSEKRIRIDKNNLIGVANREAKILNSALMKTNTPYTVIVNITELRGATLNLAVRESLSNADYKVIANNTGVIKFLYTPVSGKMTSISEVFLFIEQADYDNGGVADFTDLMFLEGDWTNKPTPTPFRGLKSLGEDEGNLVEVKCGVLNESSYDPTTGTPKLSIVSGTNYITSDNLIVPTIEAQVKRGEVKLSDLTAFGKVDNLVGDELVEFTKIKGRTVQNLINYSLSPAPTYTSNYTTVDWLLKHMPTKPNTTYSIVNLTGKRVKCNINKVNGEYITTKAFDVGSIITYSYTEEFKIVNFNTSTYSEWTDINKNDIKNILVLEGDYTNTPLDQLPYVDGIKSVGENENNKVIIKRTGKNLFNKNETTVNKVIDIANGSISTEYKTEKQWYLSPIYKINTEVTKVTIYNGNPSMLRENIRYRFLDINVQPIVGQYNDCIYTNGYCVLNKPTNAKYVQISVLTLNLPLDGVELYLGDKVDNREPYKEYKQEITLKEPLRSLPNGVHDTIEGNKVIRRIGKLVLNGTENWTLTSNQDTNCIMFNLVSNPSVKTGSRLLCDKFLYSQSGDYERVNCTGNIFVNITKSRLVSQDVQGFKTWLAQNPTTIYYELANPVEEPIEPNYDKESIKTYQLDAPLRSLPNGIKDEIVGNKLIRRCGEVILNGTEYWDFYKRNTEVTFNKTTAFETSVINGLIMNNNLDNRNIYCTGFKPSSFFSIDEEGIFTKGMVRVAIANNKLTTLDVASFKTWLSQNPVKLIYELATPIEIPLKEAHSNTANFTLQRQFNSGKWLRELPNGVKDTIENGKVIRRVGKYTLNGSEVWSANVGDTLSAFVTTIPLMKISTDRITKIVNNYLRVEYKNPSVNECMYCGDNNNNLVVVLSNSRLSAVTSEGLKLWLSKNPITVLYELATPTEEALSTDNYMPYPYHEINTYCGSLYVGNGTNDVFVEGLKNDSVIVNTPFRSISNKAIVTDCKYKKNIDGYDNMYITSKTKNLADNTNLTTTSNYVGGTYANGKISLDNSSNISARALAFLSTPIYFKKGVSYIFSKHNVTGTESHLVSEVYISKTINTSDSIQTNYAYDTSKIFNLESGFYYVRVFTNSGVLQQVAFNLQIEEGTSSTSYIPFSATLKSLENTEANDVEDLRHLVSLTGFNYEQILNENFDKLLRGEL